MTRAKSIWATSDGSLKSYKEPVPFFLGFSLATLGVNLPTGQQEQLGLGAQFGMDQTGSMRWMSLVEVVYLELTEKR
jgi:hypothetical protein